MALDPDLLAAYEDSDYVVYDKPELVLKIGVPSPRLDALLEKERAPCAAFVTAANPRSKPRTPQENAAALAGLDQLIAASGYPSRKGRRTRIERRPGRAEPPRHRHHARERRSARPPLGQNAIVFIEKGRAPELVVLR